MKLTKIISLGSCVLGSTMVAAPLCSCAAKTKVQNDNINYHKLESELTSADYQKPKGAYDIQKAVKWGKNVYQNVWSLDNTNSGSRVQTIPVNQFQGNKQLEHVSYSANQDVAISTITKGSFQACSNLTTIAIPSNVTKVEDRAFFRCSNLKTISFEGFTPAEGKTDAETLENIESMAAKLAAIDFGTDAFNGVQETGTLVFDNSFFTNDTTSEYYPYISKNVKENFKIFVINLNRSGLPEKWISSSNVKISSNIISSDGLWKWDKITEETTKIENGEANIEIAAKAWGYNDASALIGEWGLVNVNGQPHKVRIIDTNHDTLTEGGTACLTFEFANVICDSNGLSINTCWRTYDKSEYGNNGDYLNSNLYKSLENEGSGTIKWYSAGLERPNLDSNINNKSIKDMLPDELKKQIKTSKHYVNIFTDSWNETEYSAGLFLPNAYNFGYKYDYYEKINVKPYNYYYSTSEESDKTGRRLKHQICLNTNYKGCKMLDVYEETGFSYGCNYAGNFHKNTSSSYKLETIGNSYWTCSPYANPGSQENLAYNVSGSGDIIEYTLSTVCYAYAVAPCFCI